MKINKFHKIFNGTSTKINGNPFIVTLIKNVFQSIDFFLHL